MRKIIFASLIFVCFPAQSYADNCVKKCQKAEEACISKAYENDWCINHMLMCEEECLNSFNACKEACKEKPNKSNPKLSKVTYEGEVHTAYVYDIFPDVPGEEWVFSDNEGEGVLYILSSEMEYLESWGCMATGFVEKIYSIRKSEISILTSYGKDIVLECSGSSCSEKY